ncbi:hypothetical protein UA08_00592 [Talaromyces atroroseus]|uniref:Major facilitator superfamily (MFS) profile domain-containing protein n=1 Tax=Talaromyces atroroseus TaxID=1441469 RepID=A0A225AWQ4_TALAT|nr:hypothetical protein UA08_00592 [Talaromyces atroroseus]OKL64043.1 hypothetical protein UA08_00592 [Talaromyces atroroseus]
MQKSEYSSGPSTSAMAIKSTLQTENEGKDKDMDMDMTNRTAVDLDDSQSGKTPKPLTGLTLLALMASITLAAFLLLLDASIVATAVPKITGQFHSLDQVGWYGTAYLAANCACQPLTGKIYTFFSIKWTYLTFFALFEIGSALCGGATSSNMLIVGRAVAGLGGSGLLNGSYTIIAATLPVAKQPSYRGILMGLAILGLVGGPLIGGVLTEYASWRWCFLINLPCGGVVALFLILIPIPDMGATSDGKQTVLGRLRRLDLIGFVLFAPTMLMLIFALEWGGVNYAWKSAMIIGLFCGSFGNLLVFIAWEHRMGSGAMIPLALIRRRVIWSSCLNMAFMVGCTMVITYYFPIYFQAVRGASPTQSGVDMLPQILSNMIITIITGILVGRVGYYVPFSLASGICMSIGSGLISTITATSPNAPRIGYQILQGAQGFGFQIPILAVQDSIRREEVSTAVAMVVFSQNFGGAIFLAIAEVIFSGQLRRELAIHAPDVNADVVIAAGTSAADVRAAVSPSMLPGVLVSYSKTFNHVTYLAVGAACGVFVSATAMGWVRLRKEEDEEEA